MNLETKSDSLNNNLNTFLQAVIDARSLLAELNNFSKVHKTKFQSNLSMTSLSPGAHASSIRKELPLLRRSGPFFTCSECNRTYLRYWDEI